VASIGQALGDDSLKVAKRHANAALRLGLIAGLVFKVCSFSGAASLFPSFTILPSGGDTKYILLGHVIGSYGIGVPAAIFSAFVLHFSVWGVFGSRALEEVFVPAFNRDYLNRMNHLLSNRGADALSVLIAFFLHQIPICDQRIKKCHDIDVSQIPEIVTAGEVG
jgi:Na+-driven multidrug efflux pump